MRDKNRIIIFIIAAVLLIGAALAFVFIGRGEQLEQANIPAPVEDVAVTVATLSATEVMEDVEPTQAEVEEEKTAPTPRAGLVATDPGTVELTSGDLQLIEVFAFW